MLQLLPPSVCQNRFDPTSFLSCYPFPPSLAILPSPHHLQPISHRIAQIPQSCCSALTRSLSPSSSHPSSSTISIQFSGLPTITNIRRRCRTENRLYLSHRFIYTAAASVQSPLSYLNPECTGCSAQFPDCCPSLALDHNGSSHRRLAATFGPGVIALQSIVPSTRLIGPLSSCISTIALLSTLSTRFSWEFS